MNTRTITPHPSPETPESGAFVETALTVDDIEAANAAERSVGLERDECLFLGGASGGGPTIRLNTTSG